MPIEVAALCQRLAVGDLDLARPDRRAVQGDEDKAVPGGQAIRTVAVAGSSVLVSA
ncbi:hypothetical protein GCM10010388_26220 [Streptomyces mauvecolor]